MENLENNKEYKKLVADWQTYKGIESDANATRLKIEKRLLEITKGQLKDKGSNNLPDNLQITTGYSESWNNDAIERVKAQFDEGLTKLPFFPFEQVWKANNKQISALKEMCNDIFEESFAEALTIKPKKVAFKIKGSK